jgi:hypothetical protein
MMSGGEHLSVRRLALAAALLSACGGLETPVGDVVPLPPFGSVSGRLVGAGAGTSTIPAPYAYPLGRPDLKVAIAADGTYQLDGVPTGAQAIVLWDGVERAELVSLSFSAEGEARISDRYGSNAAVVDAQKMPFAGSVLAAVAPEGGAIAWLPSFTMRSTDLSEQRPLSGGVTTVYPLPGGTFDLAAVLPGFVEGSTPVTVLAAATVTAQVTLPIDPTAPAPGCGSSPGCENGLVCNVSDGRCYVCTASDTSNCLVNEVCDSSTGLCKSTGQAAICSACAADAECQPGICVIPSGSSAGYCSRTCVADTDCPSGFFCGDTSKRCKAPEGCEKWLLTMGATCLSSERCDDALDHGRCEHPEYQAGYCTAPCKSSTDCRIGSGLASTFNCTGGYCTPP